MKTCQQPPTFSDRAGYLSWRSEWKVAYKLLSADIRAIKQGIRAGMRRDVSVFCLQWRLPELRAQAAELLNMRSLSKQRAAAQYRPAQQKTRSELQV